MKLLKCDFCEEVYPCQKIAHIGKMGEYFGGFKVHMKWKIFSHGEGGTSEKNACHKCIRKLLEDDKIRYECLEI
jgi:hypothetical protein